MENCHHVSALHLAVSKAEWCIYPGTKTLHCHDLMACWSQVIAVGERANAMMTVDFLNVRGANVKFRSIAEPPSENEWHTKGKPPFPACLLCGSSGPAIHPVFPPLTPMDIANCSTQLARLVCSIT